MPLITYYPLNCIINNFHLINIRMPDISIEENFKKKLFYKSIKKIKAIVIYNSIIDAHDIHTYLPFINNVCVCFKI